MIFGEIQWTTLQVINTSSVSETFFKEFCFMLHYAFLQVILKTESD